MTFRIFNDPIIQTAVLLHSNVLCHKQFPSNRYDSKGLNSYAFFLSIATTGNGCEMLCFLYSYSGIYSNAFPWKRVEMSAWVTGAQTHNICTCLLRSAHILACICSLPFSLFLSFLFFHVQFIPIYILYAYKLILNINIKQHNYFKHS